MTKTLEERLHEHDVLMVKVEAAQRMRSQGYSLREIAKVVERSHEWVRQAVNSR